MKSARQLLYYLPFCFLLFSTRIAIAQELQLPVSLQPENLSPRLSSSTERVGDIDIHYVSGGEGPVVLLWHGFLGNWASWRKVLPLLAEDYTVIAPDMRGYGHSSVPDSSYAARTVMEDMRGLVQRLGHDRIHIIAHDMGAPSALLYAADYPEEVASITYLDEPVMLADTISDLIEMTPENTHYGGLWWWMVAQSPSMTETIILGNERNYIDWFYDHYTMVDGAIEEEARQYFAADLVGKRGIHGWFGVYRDVFTTMEQTAALVSNKIVTPVLGIGAEASLGDKVGQMLEAVASDVTTQTMQGSGHFIAEEKPHELVDRFSRFVNEKGR